jgi:glycosyltransferase involved in cell wall biosynthesis
MPRITVLMPVFNGETYLYESISSLLNQSFSDFEFLIVNDGSWDRSRQIIESFHDPRIRVLHHEVNQGLITCLNEGIRVAEGEFIARMDADDISLPDRLRVQLEFMEKNTHIGVCGAGVQVLGTNDIWRMPVNAEEVKCFLMFRCCLAHPTVMIRKRILDDTGIRYNANYIHAEDYHMWTELMMHTNLVNLPDVLLLYRLHESQVSRQYREQQSNKAWEIQLNQLDRLGLHPTEEEARIHWGMCYEPYTAYPARDKWIQKLLKKNLDSRLYDPYVFARVLAAFYV